MGEEQRSTASGNGLVQAGQFLGEAAAGSGARSVLAWPSAIFLTIAGFMAFDLSADIEAGYPPAHIWLEVAALALALVGVARTAIMLWRDHHQARQLRRDLAGTQADLAHWREQAHGLLRGLAAGIDEQLREWNLSAAEQEVAWLILRGLSYREVAEVRRTTERTVRHQAIAIFHKAGLAGRAEMAAFFLEDLLDVRPDAPQPPVRFDPRVPRSPRLGEGGAA